MKPNRAALITLALATVVTGLISTACVDQSTGDFALCCTCLAQKSPVNDGDALSDAENCLPDADGADPGEVDQCNDEAAAAIADPEGEHPIHVVDELCKSTTCDEECKGAIQFGAKLEVEEQSLSQ